MSNLRTYPFILLVLCSIVSVGTTARGDSALDATQNPSNGIVSEQAPEYGSPAYWRADTIRRFDEWKAKNPDYEKQIYQGVKRTQKDLLGVLRISAIALVILIPLSAFLVVILWATTRKKRVPDAPSAEKLRDTSKATKATKSILGALRGVGEFMGRRGVLFKVSLSLAVMIFFVVGLEVYLRQSNDPAGRVQSTAGMWDLTPCWPHGYQKGASVKDIANADGSTWDFTSNKNGFRANKKDQKDELVQPGKDHRELRVAVIGSSYILGYSTSDEETLTAQFEDLLNESNLFPWPAKVMNFGGPGRSGAVTVFKGYFCDVQQYAPDVIVWASGPDYPMDRDLKGIIDDLKTPPAPDWREKKSNYVDENGFLRAYSTEKPWLRELVTRSALVRHIVSRLRITRFNKASTRSFADDLVRLVEGTPAFASDVVKGHDILASEGKVMFFLLQRGVAVETFDQYGIRDIDPWGDIVDELSANGVPVVSSVGHLNHEKYYSPDSHWSEAGNRVIAENLLKGFENHRQEIIAAYVERLKQQGMSAVEGVER